MIVISLVCIVIVVVVTQFTTWGTQNSSRMHAGVWGAGSLHHPTACLYSVATCATLRTRRKTFVSAGAPPPRGNRLARAVDACVWGARRTIATSGRRSHDSAQPRSPTLWLTPTSWPRSTRNFPGSLGDPLTGGCGSSTMRTWRAAASTTTNGAVCGVGGAPGSLVGIDDTVKGRRDAGEIGERSRQRTNYSADARASGRRARRVLGRLRGGAALAVPRARADHRRADPAWDFRACRGACLDMENASRRHLDRGRVDPSRLLG